MARVYGWTPEYLDTRVTDEQLFAYLDAHYDHLKDESDARFDTLIEAVRSGTIFARNHKQYQSWRRKTRRPDEKIGLTGQALESAIMGMAVQHPEYVIIGESK